MNIKIQSNKTRNIIIGLFSFPYPSKTRLVLLENLVSILQVIAGAVLVVTYVDPSFEEHFYKFRNVVVLNINTKLIHVNSFRDLLIVLRNYLIIQFKFFMYAIMLRKIIDIAFFFVGINDFIPLMLFLKSCKKKIVWY